MADPLPTTDEFFGAPGPPPAPPRPAAPINGAANNDVWSSLKSAGGRILNSMGYGWQDSWGAASDGLSEQDQAALQRAGLLPDYVKGNQNFFNTASEALIRPAASAVHFAVAGPGAILHALSEGSEQTAEEIEGGAQASNAQRAVAYPFHLAGAVAESARTGGFGAEFLPEAGVTARVGNAAASDVRLQGAAQARSVGAVAEGEAGFYDAKPLTPEIAEARTSAAAEAGIEPPQPEPPPPDIHSLARRIDPETFEQYDALNAESALHRATLARLADERVASPEAIEAQGQIDTILGRVNNVPSRLTNAARGRLEAAQARLDAALSAETPEMAETRARLMDADYAMRDLAVDVSAAYRQAREIAPDLPETAPAEQPEGAAEAEEEGAPEPTAEMSAESEIEARAAAVAGASPEGQAEVAPARVTGNKTLGEPARPEEAGAALARAQAREAEPVTGPAAPLEAAEEPIAAAAEAAPAAPQPYAPTEQGEAGGLPVSLWRQAAADVEEHRSPRPPRANILQAMRQLGGMKVRDAEGRPMPGPDVQDALRDFKNKPPGMINNVSGLSPEYMHDALAQRGWFGQGDVGPEALVDAIAKQARGADVFHPESWLAEAHARRGELDRDMTDAGVTAADSHTTATMKLAEWRFSQQRMAEDMDRLRARADALGVPHGAETTYDALMVDVIEREAIQGEADPDDFTDYERDIERGLSDADLDELDRLAAERFAAEHGESEGAFRIPDEREPAAGQAPGRGEPAAGAGGRGHGAPEPAEQGLGAVRGTGEAVTRGLAAHTEEDAIAAGLTEGFGDLPEYQRLSLKDQAAKTFEFVSRDYDAAKRVAMGLEPPPAGLLPESVYVGVEKRALREGDVETIRQLATASRLSTEATTMGQRIRTLGERDRTSPVGAIQAVQRAREAAFARRGDLGAAMSATVSEIKSGVRDAASQPGAFAGFLKTLECD